MELSDLIGKAIDHGLSSVEDARGPLIPFTLVLQDHPDPKQRQLTLTRHAGEYLEDCLLAAQNSITPESGGLMYSLAWDGFVTIDGRKWDAILVEAGDSFNADGVIFAQRYEAKETGFFKKKRRNVAVGDPIRVRSAPSRFISSAA
jgi:hypothetical protein